MDRMEGDQDVDLMRRRDWEGRQSIVKCQLPLTADTDESGFTAVIFAKDKDKMDAAFNGDVAKALSGAKVKLQGTIEPFREKPEIKIAKPTQISITERWSGPLSTSASASASSPHVPEPLSSAPL